MPFDDYATSESFDTSTVASYDKDSVQRFLADEQVSEEGSGVFVLDEVSEAEADTPNYRYGDDSKHIDDKSKSKTVTKAAKARSSKRLPSTQQVSTKRAAKR